jgi:16S rRNA (adenine1518-N6/adenine1519-N6)-dimethyltransferase
VTPVTPKKALGQHFLVDRNVLGVIERLARLTSDDVVVEIGPGLGVLTTFLADRVRHVHAVEVDRTLEPTLGEALGQRRNVDLVFADALRFDLGGFDPPPGKLVANLPYNVATPIVAETLTGVPAITSWCVMVQREVADRFFAEPGTKAYGAVSVLVRLHARRTGFHAVSRNVFRPPPNVDSALVAFERILAPPNAKEVLRVVNGAFGHRRKTLGNALALAGLATREKAVEALAVIERPADVRAEALSPDEFVQLAGALDS